MQVQLNGSTGPVSQNYRSQSLDRKHAEMQQVTRKLFQGEDRQESNMDLDDNEVTLINIHQELNLPTPNRESLLESLTAEIDAQVQALFGNQI